MVSGVVLRMNESESSKSGTYSGDGFGNVNTCRLKVTLI